MLKEPKKFGRFRICSASAGKSSQIPLLVFSEPSGSAAEAGEEEEERDGQRVRRDRGENRH